NELVICFDKYEVGPGYMGMQEFIIPNYIVESLQK
ncbi:MAG: RsiV family protein, partial [Romboutsia sp.]